MRGVHQLDRHLVLARRHTADVDRVAVARVGPQPGQVVDAHVQVADPRGQVQGLLPEHREDAAVLRPVLDPDDALGQPVGERLIHDQFGWRLVLDSDVRRGAANLLRAPRGGLCIGASESFVPTRRQRQPLQLQPVRERCVS